MTLISIYHDTWTTKSKNIQDIAAHLFGGIPAHDIDMLQSYWTVYPSMRNELFDPIPDRPGYYKLTQSPDRVRTFIMSHSEYIDFNNTLYACYSK